ncbi:S8 family serine peptidase [Phytohabitans houttuyneae]|uniref:Peptidase S8/S53 domain-containing protein n=1 Tax=Phytohabitans houttuyneae TaxID=1076126 RepID=A0A6V8K6C6_9ACTN|nr:S8 family serine peptidase [Phytohabitans houttuyneae]GFJ77689.1 hypothetical protein Phou_018690 [Phytohabitans houttuyneae]
MSRFARAATVFCVAAAMSTAGAVPAAAAPARQNCVPAGPVIPAIPWAQKMLGPERVRPFTRGGGEIVAVLDSGVDASHPRLGGGRVLEGFDAVAGSGRADDDCLGTGTQIAGVIGASDSQATGFAGLAPDVSILPIRVVADRIGTGTGTTPQVLASGIRAAVARKADVIVVSTITYDDNVVLQAAVSEAINNGVVVVAAVGDLGDRREVVVTPYPAAYEGVIGVGAIRESGLLLGKSQQGDYVDLVAPGENVTTLSIGGGMSTATGTGVAAGFVGAAAALVHSRRGDLREKRGGIEQQLGLTAVPSPGGTAYGRGIVDPYMAVTARLGNVSAQPLPDLPPLATGESAAWARARDVAMIGTGIAVAAVLIVLVVAVVMPRGRRRFWRSGVAPAPKRETEPDEPGPPVQLFP